MSPTRKIAQPRAVGSTHHHADFQEEGIYSTGGTQQPMIMGGYGIGVNRLVAAVIEQRHEGPPAGGAGDTRRGRREAP